MGCRLFGDNPLSELMMVYSQFDPKEHISMKFYLKLNSFHSRKCIWRCHLQKKAAILSWPQCVHECCCSCAAVTLLQYIRYKYISKKLTGTLVKWKMFWCRNEWSFIIPDYFSSNFLGNCSLYKITKHLKLTQPNKNCDYYSSNCIWLISNIYWTLDLILQMVYELKNEILWNLSSSIFFQILIRFWFWTCNNNWAIMAWTKLGTDLLIIFHQRATCFSTRFGL